VERDQLREMISSREATVSDLGLKLSEVESLEKSISDEARRLRTKNEWMAGRIDGLLELVRRLEDSERGNREAAAELRLRAERHSAGEADLRRELDNAVDEHLRAETRSRRWVSQLEAERDALAARVDELADRNAELEGREAALECRVRRLETIEQGLRSDLERAVRESDGEIVEERLLVEPASEERPDRFRSNSQTTGFIAFLKQKLEEAARSNAVLEDRLREKAVCEDRLREAIREFEKSDGAWQEKVAGVEARNKALVQKIDDLQAQLPAREVSSNHLISL